jgi:hypothetical protein
MLDRVGPLPGLGLFAAPVRLTTFVALTRAAPGGRPVLQAVLGTASR